MERDADRCRRRSCCESTPAGRSSTGLALVDYVRAADFQTRHLLLALDTGEPYRIACALAAEAGFFSAATAGHGAVRRSSVRRAPKRSLHGQAIRTRSRCARSPAVPRHSWSETGRRLRPTAIARSAFCETQSAGTIWELNSAHVFRLGALLYQGKLRECARELRHFWPPPRGAGTCTLKPSFARG